MSRTPSPILDPRDAQALLAELLARQPAYVPGWQPRPGGPGTALLHVFARYAQTLVERLNQAPDRNRLAFLDLLGVSLLPAAAARAPVVFQPIPRTGDARVPARTRIGAAVPGRTDPVVFETERAIALAGARLAEVRTVWPAQDTHAEHTADVAAGRPFTLFEPRRPVPHELYVAHDTVFAFVGRATLEIEVELTARGSEPLEVMWESWDGQAWRGFRAFDTADPEASQDGTAGLTRSGVVTLRAECGRSQKTTVDGVEAHWVRARLVTPLPPDPARILAMIDRLRVRSVLQRTAAAWAATPPTPETGVLGVRWRLRDETGAPLPGVDLSLTEVLGSEVNSGDFVTDSTGTFAAQALGTGAKHTLVVDDSRFPEGTHDVVLGSQRVHIDLTLTLGPKPDHAFADGTALDLSKTFQPLGPQPRPGSVFHLGSEEAFGKPGAVVSIWMKGSPPVTTISGGTTLPTPTVAWEYWNGQRWAILGVEGHDPVANTESPEAIRLQAIEGVVRFTVPPDLVPVEVHGREAHWIRARLVGGGYGVKKVISTGPPVIAVIEMEPPALEDIRLGYVYRSAWEWPEHCATANDFQVRHHDHAVRWPGGAFPPFHPVADVTPALYLGFDRPLPADLVSLFLDVEEEDGREAGTPLAWEYWDGARWAPLPVEDETHALARRGLVGIVWPGVPPPVSATILQGAGTRLGLAEPGNALRFTAGDPLHVTSPGGEGELAVVAGVDGPDALTLARPLARPHAGGTVERAALPRFGTPRTWIRARLRQDGAAPRVRLNGIHLNAVWAAQQETVENELLGSASGEPSQVFFARRTPVLEDEVIEVRELDGPRAAVELPMLREELERRGLTGADVRLVSDPRSGQLAQVWVRWRARPTLLFSAAGDRDVALERSRGRIVVGDGERGRLPPPGRDSVRLVHYRAGGGLHGNVPAGALRQALSGVPAKAVSNPRGAEGGADGEPIEAVQERGPLLLRHRRRACSADDYEALAREASPGVAVARALPTTAPNGRPAPGSVRLIIVPQSHDPRPQPSFELRRRVRDFIRARGPASLGGLAVVGPDYQAVGVEAVVVPREASAAGPVRERVLQLLARFLHPLTGGPDGAAWPFGRDVHLSDVAARLQRVDGVDHVAALNLLLDDTPRSDVIHVPPDRIVVAGPLEVRLAAGDG